MQHKCANKSRVAILSSKCTAGQNYSIVAKKVMTSLSREESNRNNN